MKVTLWMAMSLNGMIARKNNEEDFLSHDNWLNWLDALKETPSIIWGRKTHEIVKNWPKSYFDDIKNTFSVIVSSDKTYKLEDQFVLADSPKRALEILEKKGFEEVLLTGGSKLNTSFAKEGLIDEVVLSIEPVIVGEGIPLFDPSLFDLKLEPINITQAKGNTMLAQYKVVK